MEMLIQLVQSYLHDIVLWSPDGDTVAKLIALVATFTGIVQVVKKGAELGTSFPIATQIPVLGSILEFLAHGKGPIILNLLVTVPTMIVAAASDNRIQGGEVAGLITAIGAALVGNDWMYKALRKWVFPKGIPGIDLTDEEREEILQRARDEATAIAREKLGNVKINVVPAEPQTVLPVELRG